MEPDDRLDDLLDAWQEAFSRGENIRPADLCRDYPELLPEVERQVEAIRRMAALHRPAADGLTVDYADPSGEATATPGGTPPEPLPGDAPHGYDLLGELGRGGMGVVYKAWQKGLKRVVALKMLRSGVRASAAELLRFRTEGEAVARLDHPHVVRVHEVGVHAGRPYLALEYCPGGTLEDKLAGNPLPPREAAGLTAKLARAVAAAHAAGIVHRDLKPLNVLLTADGIPKVADFGLAKWVDSGDGMTATGDVFGTPGYMAPEQASGHTRAIDRRADVYALGAVLYACLTGRPPFKGATPLDTLDQVRSHDPVGVRALQPSVPRDLETVCLKCLRKDAGQRYASAADLADDLDRFLGGLPVRARPVGSVDRAWRWCRRNPAVAALLALVLVSSLTGTAVATWYADRADTARQAAVAERKKTEDANDKLIEQQKITEEALDSAKAANDGLRTERAEADEARKQAQREAAAAVAAEERAVRAQRRAEWSAYVSGISLAQREWEVGNAPAAFTILEGTNPALRGWEYEYLSTQFHRDRKWAGKHADPVQALAVSPDETRVATASDAELVVWEAVGGKVVFRAPNRGREMYALAYSPDGRVILTGEGFGLVEVPGRIQKWDAQTGRPLGTLITLPGGVRDMHFLPGGDRVVAACADGYIYWIDSATGRVVNRPDTPDRHWSVRLACSPDGKLLAVHALRRPVRLFDGESGRLIRAVERPDTGDTQWPELHGFAFSPDGTRLAVGGRGERGLFVWDVATGKCVLVGQQEGGIATRVAWTPDGRSVVLASEDRTVSVIDPRTGLSRVRLRGHLNPVYGLGVTNGAVYSGSGDGAVIAWHPDLPSDPQPLRSPGQGWFGDVAFSPDGSSLLSVEGGSPTVGRLWDLRTGRAVRLFSGHTAYITALAASRDGTVAFTSSEDGTARKWDVKTGACTGVFRDHAGAVTGVVCSPRGEWVASAGVDGTVRLWDPATVKRLRTLAPGLGPADRVTTDPDGRLLVASFGAGRVVVWDTATWGEVHRLEHGGTGVRGLPSLAVAVTRDRRSLLTGGRNGRLCLWDLADGKLVWSRDTTPYPVHSVAFLPGEAQFVTGGGAWAQPGEVKVWNTATGENTFTMRGSGRELYGVAVNPVSGAVAASSHEGIIRVWGHHAAASTVIADWHRRLWREAEQKGDWVGAAFHLSGLAKLTPEEPGLHLLAARFWELAGRPELAALHAVGAYLRDPSLPSTSGSLAFPEGGERGGPMARNSCKTAADSRTSSITGSCSVTRTGPTTTWTFRSYW